MPDPNPEKPGRRPRYRGTNPRRFAEKYKEHAAGLYPDDVARVIAAGKTPAGMHRPIMVREILQVLAPKPGNAAIDCTLGYGGHALAILDAIRPRGRLIAIDADPIEGPKAEARLREAGGPDASILVRRMNFAGIVGLVAAESPGGVDLILADLGLSSMQIDDPSRGFTFKDEGPLDMRMNPTRGQPASALLSRLDRTALARLLIENADEPHADRVADAIVTARSRSPLSTTRALADVIRASLVGLRLDPETTVDDTVRRVFQAIRIAVNDEFASLDALLCGLPTCLKPGGRVALLSFHSGEDRRVKSAFKEGVQDGIYASIAPEPIRPSAEERRDNPRSASAKLRWAVRVGMQD